MSCVIVLLFKVTGLSLFSQENRLCRSAQLTMPCRRLGLQLHISFCHDHDPLSSTVSVNASYSRAQLRQLHTLHGSDLDRTRSKKYHQKVGDSGGDKEHTDLANRSTSSVNRDQEWLVDEMHKRQASRKWLASKTQDSRHSQTAARPRVGCVYVGQKR